MLIPKNQNILQQELDLVIIIFIQYSITDATVCTAKKLEELQIDFMRREDWFDIFLLQEISIENEHLSLFYLNVPTLTLNFIEKSQFIKIKQGKRTQLLKSLLLMMVFYFRHSIFLRIIRLKSIILYSSLEKLNQKQIRS
ncbi:unnamed protein product [Paramecium sonneborni]|uniref:WASH complex subunit 7 C-terminal domain-containing protein n=1 Tax=Paramecium sonneborni TaxID=65129 RepID=A0A8S1RR81_9CILI|nr:unnamed protein product [Paramecium sonneborni]